MPLNRGAQQSSTRGKSQNWVKKAQLSVPFTLASVTHWLRGPDTRNPGESRQISPTGILASESGRGGEFCCCCPRVSLDS